MKQMNPGISMQINVADADASPKMMKWAYLFGSWQDYPKRSLAKGR